MWRHTVLQLIVVSIVYLIFTVRAVAMDRIVSVRVFSLLVR